MFFSTCHLHELKSPYVSIHLCLLLLEAGIDSSWFIRSIVFFPTLGNHKKRKATLLLPQMWSMGLLHFSSWNKSICNPEMRINKIRGPLKNTMSCQRWIPEMNGDKFVKTYLPQGQRLSSHIVGWTCPVHPNMPTKIRWTRACIGNQVLRCHPSKYSLNLRLLNLGVPMGYGLRRLVPAALEFMKLWQ